MSYLTQPEARKAIAVALESYMADTAVLYFKTHGYHWNVEGRNFRDRHKMFEEHYNELWSSLDEIAERIRALGFKAPFSLSSLLGKASLKEAEGTPACKAMVEDLRDGNMLLSNSAQGVADVSEKNGDRVTADLMTQHSARLEKNGWMLNSILSGSCCSCQGPCTCGK